MVLPVAIISSDHRLIDDTVGWLFPAKLMSFAAPSYIYVEQCVKQLYPRRYSTIDIKYCQNLLEAEVKLVSGIIFFHKHTKSKQDVHAPPIKPRKTTVGYAVQHAHME